MIGFAIENSGVFSQSFFTRKDLPIASLKLIHKDFQVSRLEIAVPMAVAKPLIERAATETIWGFLCCQPSSKCVFRGVLSPQASLDGELMVMVWYAHESASLRVLKRDGLLACPVEENAQGGEYQITVWDPAQTLELGRLNLKNNQQPDPLFFSSSKRTLGDVLQNQSLFLNFHPVTHKLTGDTWDQGEVVNLHDNFLSESWCIKEDSSLHRVRLRLRAQWLQGCYGFFNAFPWIQSLFPQNLLVSYGGDSLKKQWPKEGKLGRSGYRVLKSELVKTKVAKGQDGKRSFFKGALWIGWDFKRRRQEEVEVEVSQGLDHEGPVNTRDITFNLEKILPETPHPWWYPNTFYQTGEICQYDGTHYRCLKPHISQVFFSREGLWEKAQVDVPIMSALSHSFFTTDRGRQALEYGLDCAKAMLDRGCYRLVSFQGSWRDLARVHSGQVIKVMDPLERREVVGKVVKSELFAAKGKGTVKITLAIFHRSPRPQGSEVGASPLSGPYVEEDYAVEGGTSYWCGHDRLMTPKGVAYADYRSCTPKDEYQTMGHLPPCHMIKTLKIIRPEETDSNPGAKKQDSPRVFLEMRGLREKDIYRHMITLHPIYL